MENALFWLAAATLAIHLVALVVVLRGNRSIRFLSDVPPVDSHSSTSVSVLIPARNEERNIRAALRSINFSYFNWKSMLRTLLEGGIRWRGTHYPLAELRANEVRAGRGAGEG